MPKDMMLTCPPEIFREGDIVLLSEHLNKDSEFATVMSCDIELVYVKPMKRNNYKLQFMVLASRIRKLTDLEKLLYLD